MLPDLLQVGLHHLRELCDFRLVIAGSAGVQNPPKLVEKLKRDFREIVDEVERILDFMGDAGGELTQRGEFLGLDQTVLSELQFGKRYLGGFLCLPRRFFVSLQLRDVE